MKKLLAGLFCMLLGGAAAFGAFHYHVVWTKDGLTCVEKTRPELDDAWVDVRGWDAVKWSKHPRLAAALIKAGKGNVVVRAKPKGFLKRMFEKFDAAARGDAG